MRLMSDIQHLVTGLGRPELQHRVRDDAGGTWAAPGSTNIKATITATPPVTWTVPAPPPPRSIPITARNSPVPATARNTPGPPRVAVGSGPGQ